jgi:hypothetical protein
MNRHFILVELDLLLDKLIEPLDITGVTGLPIPSEVAAIIVQHLTDLTGDILDAIYAYLIGAEMGLEEYVLTGLTRCCLMTGQALVHVHMVAVVNGGAAVEPDLRLETSTTFAHWTTYVAEQLSGLHIPRGHTAIGRTMEAEVDVVPESNDRITNIPVLGSIAVPWCDLELRIPPELPEVWLIVLVLILTFLIRIVVWIDVMGHTVEHVCICCEADILLLRPFQNCLQQIRVVIAVDIPLRHLTATEVYVVSVCCDEPALWKRVTYGHPVAPSTSFS